MPMLPEEIQELARSTITAESSSVMGLIDQIDETFVEVAHTLLNCQGHVLVAGSGTNNPVAARFAHLLSCSGTPALFIHPGDSQHGLSGAVTDKDVLVAISKGGTTAEVNVLVEIARKRGATIVGIMEVPDSPLGRMSDLILRVQPAANVDPYGMIATGSSLTTCAMTDAMCTVLLRLRGYTRESFGETHPGGAVGKKLQSEQTEEGASFS